MPRSRSRAGSTAAGSAGPRVCAEEGCETRLSVYNDAEHCSLHHPTVLLRTRGRHIA
ncbi:hypothetical protein HC251_20785 [Iamia sp. SCSIO 61187]|uniref:hypothetical protein n=1 Tax=Iamia sp. SCSIO 61187 TaxID=2722752 RepID=UPI001C625DF9|nr:hypothetical protein [Iamia sp. SCSIO 61187]QYG94632.1 hypothetical protein HC251_20785 [Iamia sp. SCSIO 61187]